MRKDLLLVFAVMIVSAIIASNWNSIPLLKNSVDSVLNPTFGELLKWNIWVGFIVIIAFTSFILTLSQKYLSDQEQLKEIRKEQKYLQGEMKKYKDHPEKLLEFQKKQLEFFPRTFELTIKPVIYTSIPIILLFRWFADYLHPVFGGWWFFYYIIGSMIFSSIFRKMLDVA
jgi:uncharacterized membrane protein (DUF106 family)